MGSEILKKLQTFLGKLPTTESELVYSLVQIRKLLELNNHLKSFVDLKFFCDWTLHAKLEGPSARKMAAKLVKLANPHPNSSENHTVRSEVHQIFTFGRFRQQLAEFCHSVDLIQVWTPTAQSWRQCLMLYANVVVDCPLSIIPESASKGIQKAVLRAYRLGDVVKAEGDIEYFPFGFRWQLTAEDGRVVNFSINAS